MPRLKIFVSSPMDVSPERAVALRVIKRLAVEYTYYFEIEPVMSELEPMMATDTPQSGIQRPSESNIVIVLLWSRLGTPLPDDERYKVDDTSRRPTGTEWEFYDAYRAQQVSKGDPDILVYRKTDKISAEISDEDAVLEAIKQKKQLDQFLERWSRSPDGSWKGWYHPFSKEEELEHLFDTHLRKLIQKRIEANQASSQSNDAPTAKVIEGNPFRGLNSFNIEDAPLFFGRTAAISELREILETQNALHCGFVLVTGSSGSGKSSLVKAGLLADLQVPNRIGRVSLCRHAIMRPSDQEGQLLLGLAEAILQPTAFPELRSVGWTPDDLARVAGEDPQRLIESLRHAALLAAKPARVREPSEVRLCLVVDQLEEIFTAGIAKPLIDKFARLLSLLARSDVVWIVATLRSDFYHRLDEVPPLLYLADRGYYRLKSPLATEIGQMVRRPAQLAGLRFEKHPETGIGLDERLQDDAISDPTALPLLEFALQELWNQRSAGGLLSFNAYERMGRMTGAIAERAEELIVQLSENAQEHVAPLLRSLITVSQPNAEPTAATVLRSAVATTPERTEILDSLIQARLVVTDDLEKRGDPKCRLAHEKLIESWPRLKKLAEADRAFLEARSRLVSDASAWLGRDKPSDLLLPAGSRLLEGEQCLRDRRDELDKLTTDFIGDSLVADRANRNRALRRSRLIATGFGALSILTFGLFVMTYLKQLEVVQIAEEAKRSADRANRGFGLALRAVATLAQTAGTSGSNLESVMQDADGMLKDIVDANRADHQLVEQRATLLLSFASASERLGDYPQQRNRAREALTILEPLCGRDQSDSSSCIKWFSSAHEATGHYNRNAGNIPEATDAYRRALAGRKRALAAGASPELLLDRAGTEAALAGALIDGGQVADGLELARACADTVKSVSAGSDAGTQLMEARCLLKESAGLRKLSKPAEALQAAGRAQTLLSALNTQSPQNVDYLEQLARAHQELAIAHWDARQPAPTLTHVLQGSQLLQATVRSNPQNDQLATLLSELLLLQSQRFINRPDLAVRALEDLIELARVRQATPRAQFWRQIELNGLSNLSQRYETLGRHQDALVAAEQEVAVRRAGLNQQSGSQPWPADLLWALERAGERAKALANGRKAYEYLSQVLDHAERHLGAYRASGRDPATQFTPFNELAYFALSQFARITHQNLPEDQRVATLEAIAARAARYAAAEPRIIPFRLSQGRSLYELATAQEAAGDLAAARATHERASKAGWRTSTIVLRRWYLEGFGGVPQDLRRALELEELAKGQGDLPTWDIEVRYRSNGSTANVTLYFKEPEGDGDPMADEVYRLSVYHNAEITAEGRRIIDLIYRLAREGKATVANFLKQERRFAQSSNELPKTAISEDVKKAREALKAKNLADAYQLLLDARRRLDSAQAPGESADVLAWGELAEGFGEIETAAREAKDQGLVTRAAAAGEEATKQVLRANADGSSPRMRLADRIELLGRRAQRDWADRAVRFYRRGNELRDLVRVEDPKNAECQCGIARNFRAIARIESGRGRFDVAGLALQRALHIYEDLNQFEPERDWEAHIAVTASELAEVLGRNNEPRTALYHAQTNANIHSKQASQHSADSTSRLDYAKALELVALYARRVGNDLRPSNRRSSDTHFQLAVASLEDANAIRESVLIVDPSNGECRCQVASNLDEIARIYQDWGRLDEWRKNLDRAVALKREIMEKEPDNKQWRYNLVISLEARARGMEKINEKDYAPILQDLYEAAGLLRPLLADFPDAKDRLVTLLGKISFKTLFVSRDADSLAAAEEALALKADELWIETNKAHALMYLGRTQQALAIHRANKGKKIGNSTWDKEVAADFALLKAAGRPHPLMEVVLREFTGV